MFVFGLMHSVIIEGNVRTHLFAELAKFRKDSGESVQIPALLRSSMLNIYPNPRSDTGTPKGHNRSRRNGA